jgi:FlaG/FlaF family flagellin (archaellin)
MNLRRDDKAVSEVVGTVLLLSMAICLFSLLSAIVLSYPVSSNTPSANLIGTVEGEYLFIEHRGGTPLRLDTKVLLTIEDGKPKKIQIGDYLDDSAREDNWWGIGEWCIYQNEELNGKKVAISIVDVETNSVIMTSLLQGT